jgi:hypothetical protein
MPIPQSGQISLAGTIGVELGRTSTQTISLSESTVAALAGLSIGAQVSFSTFYGKSNTPTYNLTIASNTANYNMRTAAIAAGWNGSAAAIINCTINNGVYVYSTSTGSYAFDTGTGYPASGVTLNLTNNGVILGMGGAGGEGRGFRTGPPGNPGPAGGLFGSAGSGGGPALNAQRAINITNNGIVSGGGGGGGPGQGAFTYAA